MKNIHAKKFKAPASQPALRYLKIVGVLGLAAASALALSACETQIAYKDGGSALLEGDRLAAGFGNYDAAALHYEEAARSPFPEIAGQASYNLAMIAREQGDKQRYQTHLEKAAAAGIPAAQLELAKFYDGSGQQQEKTKALYEPLAGQYANASAALMEIALKENNTEAAARYARQSETILLEQIRTEGDPDGGRSLVLARLYAQHSALLGGGRDAEKLYRDSIAMGNAKAAQELASLWLASGSRPSAKSDAFALMLQAAEAGNTSAMKYVAAAYTQGNGVAKNDQQANYWYGKLPPEARKKPSAAQSNKRLLEDRLLADSLNSGKTPAHAAFYAAQPPRALYSAAKAVEKRQGKAHPDAARRAYEIAAQSGSSQAAMFLARNAKTAPDGKRNDEEALRWYKRAAELGDGKAMLFLARRARVGEGQEKNDAEAFAWFLRAAEAGEPEGQYEAGLAYVRGTGIEKDLDKARSWLEKAEAGGYVLAVGVLKSIGKAE